MSSCAPDNGGFHSPELWTCAEGTTPSERWRSRIVHEAVSEIKSCPALFTVLLNLSQNTQQNKLLRTCECQPNNIANQNSPQRWNRMINQELLGHQAPLGPSSELAACLAPSPNLPPSCAFDCQAHPQSRGHHRRYLPLQRWRGLHLHFPLIVSPQTQACPKPRSDECRRSLSCGNKRRHGVEHTSSAAVCCGLLLCYDGSRQSKAVRLLLLVPILLQSTSSSQSQNLHVPVCRYGHSAKRF